MAGKLTTHVLDSSIGAPAAGMKIALYRDERLLHRTVTRKDGRLDAPLLSGPEFEPGSYRLEFSVGDYFSSQAHPDAGRFFDVVPIVFKIEDGGADYHIPLIVTPWSYSTYRGS